MEIDMKLKKIMLGGIAIAGLMGAAPALAFTHHPGTPAEHQQTDDLNQQQLQQAGSPSSPMTAATDTGAAQSAGQTAQVSPNASGQTAQSGTNTGQAMAQETTAAPATTATNMSATMPLDSISNPPQTLANASVETTSGQAVGAVQRVITDASGKAKTVVVALLGKASRLVAIAANQLSFDQSRNVVIAQLSEEQIQSLPMAPQT
jgi:hypothetical protein